MCRKKCIKTGIFNALISCIANNECPVRAEHSILPVWHTEWAFQRQRREENVCSWTVEQQPQRALFHQNMGCSDRGGTMKIMTQMPDKDRPCTPSCFLLPHPPPPLSVFNFQSSTMMEEVKRGCWWDRQKRRLEREKAGCNRRTMRTGGLCQPGEQQTGFKNNL